MAQQGKSNDNDKNHSKEKYKENVIKAEYTRGFLSIKVAK